VLHHTHEIVAYVVQRWAIGFSIPGMNKWLHRHVFSYKKPAGIPHKFDEEKKKQFIEYDENLKETIIDKPIFFSMRSIQHRAQKSAMNKSLKVKVKP
jgi:hypothetical protein